MMILAQPLEKLFIVEDYKEGFIIKLGNFDRK